jgi:DNA processing protein
MHLSQDELDLISWCALSEPGDALTSLIWNEFGPKALESVKKQNFETWRTFISESFPEYLSELTSMEERVCLRLPRANPHQLVERGIRWNAKPVAVASLPSVAGRLSDLGEHAPLLIWVAGDHDGLERDFAGIVGTRKPSVKGASNARRLVASLRMPIVSGGARGIDRAAHEAALEIGLPTVAIMAGGLDKAYPMENWEMFHQIVRSGGVLMSEMPPGAAPSRFRFLQRNRLIAAMCRELFVVEAALRSGSRNTANHARALGRDVYALAGSWASEQSQGCNTMIQEGLAKQYVLDDPIEIESSWTTKRVQDALRAGAKTPSEIATESGINLKQVKSIMPLAAKTYN